MPLPLSTAPVMNRTLFLAVDLTFEAEEGPARQLSFTVGRRAHPRGCNDEDENRDEDRTTR